MASMIPERERAPGAKWTADEALRYIRKLGELHGRTPTPVDMVPHQGTFVQLFGSIQRAQLAAGFEPNKPGRPRLEVAT